MALMIYAVQLTLLIPVLIAFFAISLAVTFVKRIDDDSEDDCGYLEIVVNEKGGLDHEESV